MLKVFPSIISAAQPQRTYLTPVSQAKNQLSSALRVTALGLETPRSGDADAQAWEGG